MAELNLNITQQANPIPPAIQNTQKTDAAKTDAAKIERPEIKLPEKPERKTETQEEKQENLALKNVVSVSKDGDTVQVSEEATEKIEEESIGTVTSKKEETATEKRLEDQKEEAIEKAEERRQLEEIRLEQERTSPTKERLEAEKEDQDKLRLDAAEHSTASQGITSFSGYTNTQLHQLYLKGDISKQQYDSEVAAREERTEELQEENSELAEKGATLVRASQTNEQDEIQLENIFSEDANDNIEARDRAETIMTLQKNMSAAEQNKPGMVETLQDFKITT
ncbi:MAG: hypothetical protein K6F99_07515 [Lachnospiraceae bacterium]|nr:hypothetical protein [Lachnospiraceae bacterium]